MYSVFEVSKTATSFGHRLKSGPAPGPWTWRKNESLGKTRPQGLETLSFFSINVIDNVEVIHFHVKSRGLQGHAFVQIRFDNCTLNFYFENSEIGIKKQLPNCSPYSHRTFLHVYSFLCSLVLNKNVFLWN